jgi:ABC-type spermidine/putrescine transport system permease subunit II
MGRSERGGRPRTAPAALPGILGIFFLGVVLSRGDLCITLILAKIWKLTIDFIVKNMMKLANMELCRGL